MFYYDGEEIPDGYEEVEASIGNQTQKYTIQTETAIAKDTDYPLPVNYIVGNDNLEVYAEGVLLSKNYHYIEAGEVGTASNAIQFKFDIAAGSIITLKIN